MAEEIRKGILYVNGIPFGKVKEFRFEEAFQEELEELQNMIKKIEPFQVTGTLKEEKYLRCTSKKRLVKLLMSKGIGRNLAESYACYMQKITSKPYQTIWLYYLFGFPWNSIIKDDRHAACGLEANPWALMIELERCERNQKERCQNGQRKNSNC